MPSVVMDSICHQAIRHLGTEADCYPNPSRVGYWRGARLNGFIGLLSESSYDFSFINLSQDQLETIDVLIIAGRSNLLPFTQTELDNISTFYEQKGSIFIMANHQGLVAPQNQICSQLNLPIAFNERTILENNQSLILNLSHPISKDCDQGLRIRTSCTMTITSNFSGDILVHNRDQDIGVFACGHQDQHEPLKRVICITSAGHISSRDDSGRDLLSEASNRTWTINAIDWLSNNL